MRTVSAFALVFVVVSSLCLVAFAHPSRNRSRVRSPVVPASGLISRAFDLEEGFCSDTEVEAEPAQGAQAPALFGGGGGPPAFFGIWYQCFNPDYPDQIWDDSTPEHAERRAAYEASLLRKKKGTLSLNKFPAPKNAKDKTRPPTNYPAPPYLRYYSWEELGGKPGINVNGEGEEDPTLKNAEGVRIYDPANIRLVEDSKKSGAQGSVQALKFGSQSLMFKTDRSATGKNFARQDWGDFIGLTEATLDAKSGKCRNRLSSGMQEYLTYLGLYKHYTPVSEDPPALGAAIGPNHPALKHVGRVYGWFAAPSGIQQNEGFVMKRYQRDLFSAKQNLFELVPNKKATLPHYWLALKLMLRDVLHGLKGINEASFTYWDLKPENVVLDEHGHAIIVDMGGASKKPKHPNALTEQYRAPEAYRGTTAMNLHDDWSGINGEKYDVFTAMMMFKTIVFTPDCKNMEMCPPKQLNIMDEANNPFMRGLMTDEYFSHPDFLDFQEKTQAAAGDRINIASALGHAFLTMKEDEILAARAVLKLAALKTFHAGNTEGWRTFHSFHELAEMGDTKLADPRKKVYPGQLIKEARNPQEHGYGYTDYLKETKVIDLLQAHMDMWLSAWASPVKDHQLFLAFEKEDNNKVESDTTMTGVTAFKACQHREAAAEDAFKEARNTARAQLQAYTSKSLLARTFSRRPAGPEKITRSERVNCLLEYKNAVKAARARYQALKIKAQRTVQEEEEFQNLRKEFDFLERAKTDGAVYRSPDFLIFFSKKSIDFHVELEKLTRDPDLPESPEVAPKRAFYQKAEVKALFTLARELNNDHLCPLVLQSLLVKMSAAIVTRAKAILTGVVGETDAPYDATVKRMFTPELCVLPVF